MEKPLISIIIPVYNVKAHIENCVYSILDQSYEKFGIILVDDGSTDGSSEICNQLSQKSSNIQVIHKENSGVSRARNTGLDAAQGEFIIFIDSDDVISQNYVEAFVEASSDAEIIIGSIEDVYVDGAGKIYRRELRKHKAPIQGILSEEYYNLIDWLRGPVAKLYRKSIIDKYNLRFDENLSVAEDQVFNFSYYRFITSYKIEEESLYQYFHYDTKVSLSTLYTEKTFSDDVFKMNIEYNFLKKYCPTNYNTIYIYQIIDLLNKYAAWENYSNIYLYYKQVKSLAILHPLVINPSLEKKKQLVVYLLQIKLYWVVVVYYLYKYNQK